MKTLVIGLGNPFLTDDGVGVKVAQALAERLPAHPDLSVTEASVGGLRLMEMAVGYDRAILIDALYPPNNGVGTIHRMTLHDLAHISPTQHSASAHDTSLATALEMGRRMGFSLPEAWTVYAVEVANIEDFSESPTPEVARAIPRLVQTVIEEIQSYPCPV